MNGKHHRFTVERRGRRSLQCSIHIYTITHGRMISAPTIGLMISYANDGTGAQCAPLQLVHVKFNVTLGAMWASPTTFSILNF